jgi:MFS family permease
MICAIPLALLSDRLGTRRRVLMVAALLVTIGVGMLSFVQGGWILFAVVIAGMTRDGFMALTMTATMEVRGVGALYAGSATGLLMAWSGLGNVIAPPLGNSLAAISLSAPFVLWAAMAAVGFGVYFAIREDG